LRDYLVKNPVFEMNSILIINNPLMRNIMEQENEIEVTDKLIKRVLEHLGCFSSEYTPDMNCGEDISPETYVMLSLPTKLVKNVKDVSDDINDYYNSFISLYGSCVDTCVLLEKNRNNLDEFIHNKESMNEKILKKYVDGEIEWGD
jgi:hypothetical protein